MHAHIFGMLCLIAEGPGPMPAPVDQPSVDDRLFRARRLEFTGNAVAVTNGIVGGVALVAGFGDSRFGSGSPAVATGSVIMASVGLVGVVTGLTVAAVGRSRQRRLLGNMALNGGGFVLRF